MAEFAECGVDGARINRIAERARASKERIYAWFGDKEGAVTLPAHATVPHTCGSAWPLRLSDLMCPCSYRTATGRPGDRRAGRSGSPSRAGPLGCARKRLPGDAWQAIGGRAALAEAQHSAPEQA